MSQLQKVSRFKFSVKNMQHDNIIAMWPASKKKIT